MTKTITAFALTVALSFVAIPSFSTKAKADCTNSYDKASNGSNCGGRASGCKSGGKGGTC